jgi:hypothetical protein
MRLVSLGATPGATRPTWLVTADTRSTLHVVSELREKIAGADAADQIWALVVEHGDGNKEVYTGDGIAMKLAVPESIEPMRAYLIEPDPVACTVAEAAGVDLLSGCPRCEE